MESSEEEDKETVFDKLKRIQNLLHEESAIKEICK